jgi:hypothetical protein
MDTNPHIPIRYTSAQHQVGHEEEAYTVNEVNNLWQEIGPERLPLST